MFLSAYEVLSDKEKRRNYDQFGQDGLNNQAHFKESHGNFHEHFHKHFNVHDFFEEFDGMFHRHHDDHMKAHKRYLTSILSNTDNYQCLSRS